MNTKEVQRKWGRLVWILLTNGSVSLLLINGIRSKVELAQMANAGHSTSIWSVIFHDPTQWLSVIVLLCGLVAEVFRAPLARYLNITFFSLASLVLAAESVNSLIQLKRGVPGYYEGEAGIGLAICLLFIIITAVDVVLYGRSRPVLATGS